MLVPAATLSLVALIAAAPSLELEVLKDIPTKEGRWRVELISNDRPTGPMTVCTDAFVDMKEKLWQGVEEGEAEGCEPKVLANGARKGELVVDCGGVKSRLVFLKKGKADFELRYFQAEDKPTMVARYSYVGPCEEGSPELQMEADSPVCQQLRAQMAMMTPALCAAVEGAARKECEAQIAEGKKRFAEMCSGR